MSEMVERVAKALFRRAVERDVVDDTPEEWEALRESFELDARGAIEAMRTPTEAMGSAMLLARTYFEQPDENQRLTESEANKIGIVDHLAGNPSKWCMPEWRAGIDTALGKP